MTLVETVLAAWMGALVASGVVGVTTVGVGSFDRVSDHLEAVSNATGLVETWTLDLANRTPISTSTEMIRLGPGSGPGEDEVRYRIEGEDLVREVLVAGLVTHTRRFAGIGPVGFVHTSTPPHTGIVVSRPSLTVSVPPARRR